MCGNAVASNPAGSHSPACSHLRTYQFLYANGPGSLFHGYTASLDFFVKLAWDEVARLQTGRRAHV